MRDLSVLITARNEEFLSITVDDVIAKKRANTEVIVICDGNLPNPPIKDYPDVTIIYHSTSIGQRQGVNEAARLSTAKYVMKLDAHCILDEGFDVKLMADCQPDWTVIPRMYNLHVFDWICNKCGNRWYQGPTPVFCCINNTEGGARNKNTACDSTSFKREMVWKPRMSRRSDYMRFDSELHFQYWGAYDRRPEAQGDIVDIMSFVGACFFMERERYWYLDGLDEEHGSWGQMGTELACKSWLSGGRLVVNKKTWFSHMFRTQGGDFGFPYPISGKQTDHARRYSQDVWRHGKWPKAIHNLQWLVNKFAPVPGWDTSVVGQAADVSKPSKGVLYYTRNVVKESILIACQKQIEKAFQGPIVSVSSKPIKFGENIVVSQGGDFLEMFKKILTGLLALKTETVFFCEDDVLYHPAHFEFTPEKKDVYYYDQNVWRVRVSDGHAIHYDTNQLNMLCGNREFLIQHYKKRIQMLENYMKLPNAAVNSYVRSMGFEPGTHTRVERVDDFKSEFWNASSPTLDLRHETNLTANRWSKTEFRDQRNCQGWKEAEFVEGWGPIKNVLNRRRIT
jgi:glycosyltransferase involved in cell wall biosynthesis